MQCFVCQKAKPELHWLRNLEPVQCVTHVIGYVVEFLKTAYDPGRGVHYILKFVVDRFRCVS